MNLFQVPGGYVLPVTFGGTNPSATIRLRNLPGLAQLKCDALHPGSEAPVPLRAISSNGELAVPLQRGCAMVRLSK